MKTSHFRRMDRILSSRDFKCVVKTGKRRISRSFVVVIARRAEGDRRASDEKRIRLGITVSKQIGNSVVRNRLKRSIREWFRHAREGLCDGSDIVVIARRAAGNLLGSEVGVILDGTIDAARVEVNG